MDSPTKMLKNIDRHVQGILRKVDVLGLDRTPRETLLKFRQLLDDAQRYAKDYEAAEFWNEKEEAAVVVAERTQLLNELLLELSGYDLFGPTDVAQISAQLDTVRTATN